MGYLRAADVPQAPPAPIFISGSATEIVLSLLPTEDRGGSEIMGYEVWIDDGELGETFTKIESYDGLTQSFNIDLVEETDLVQGRVYRIRYLAKNEMGSSEFSDMISAAFCDLPPQPSAPTKNLELSTDTRLVIDWDFVSDTELPGGLITNYRVFMDTNISGDFVELYTASSSLK